MPDLHAAHEMWDMDTEGVIVTWIYADGAQVHAGDVICEIMTEKVQMDFIAPVSGRLQILAPVDKVLRRGELIARIEPAA